MPVSTQCQCGKRYNAKDEAAGKTVKCPACGQQMTFPALAIEQDDPFGFGNPQWQRPADPKPEVEASPVLAPIVDEPSPPTPDAAQTPSDTRPCPFCGETVLTAAKKCKHCGEFFNATDRPPAKSNIGLRYLVTGCLIAITLGVLYGAVSNYQERNRADNERTMQAEEAVRRQEVARARAKAAYDEEAKLNQAIFRIQN